MHKKKRCKQRTMKPRASATETGRITVFGSTLKEHQTNPFCAYRGADGQMCPITEGLELVLLIPGQPPAIFMACPSHYPIVYQGTEALRQQLPSAE